MEMNRKKILQAAGDKLTQLRKLKDYTRPQMASYLGITGSGYNKNENGTTLPSLETMFRLAMEDQISMDWFIFSKGPMYYNDKERSAEIEELKKQLGGEIEELKKQLALKTESEKAIQADSKKADGPDIKPEIKELIEHMESIPLLYHEILSHYQRFKIDNRALVESSLALNE
ncbi:MAG TPA: helix-turn-helix domain-containing protein [Candidatus Deferrimicrobium sp.]|nr:helix-turn-helix domain-containing protein [Candidatus Deferrimicrobium sp.]